MHRAKATIDQIWIRGLPRIALLVEAEKIAIQLFDDLLPFRQELA